MKGKDTYLDLCCRVEGRGKGAAAGGLRAEFAKTSKWTSSTFGLWLPKRTKWLLQTYFRYVWRSWHEFTTYSTDKMIIVYLYLKHLWALYLRTYLIFN